MKKILSFLLIFCCVSFLFGEEKTPKKTICLNMIVKNEKDVITRCLESVLPLIDTWVIVDTGSTDGTQAVIKEYLKNIPGHLYERPWVNFAHNRQEALELAKDKADYILFMDADDKLAYDENFKRPPLTHPFYAIKSVVNNREIWWLPRLVKSDLPWHWEGVVHEQLCCKNTVDGMPLDDVQYVYVHDGARSKDPQTHYRDIELLKKGIQDEPYNSRYYFYLARSYMTINDLPNALDAFKKRSEMKGGNEEEVFYSKMFVGLIQEKLNYDAKVIQKSLYEAHLCRPHRAEPLFYLSLKLFAEGEKEKAYKIVQSALKLPKEITDCMYIETWVYDWGLLMQSAICANATDHFAEGIEACEKVLKVESLPPEKRTEVEALYESLHKKNVAAVQKEVAALLE